MRQKIIKITAVFQIAHDDALDSVLAALQESAKFRAAVDANKSVVVEKWDARQTSVEVPE